MAKFEEAIARKQKNIFVCRTCKSKIRAPSLRCHNKKLAAENVVQKNFDQKERSELLTKKEVYLDV